MEGVSNEAASIAGQLGLGKLVYFYDDNHITIDGTTELSFTAEDRGKRLAAQGWHVQHVDDANDLRLLRKAIANAQAETAKPSLIVVRSHIAYGAPHAVDTAKSHGAPLGEDEVRATKDALGWNPDEHFVVPDDVREHMSRVRARRRARAGVEREGRRLGGEVPGAAGGLGPGAHRQAETTAGSRRCPTSRPARTSRRATPARRRWRRSSPSRRR